VAREGDGEDWQRKVQALLGLAAADPLAYRKLREQAAARARERFDWSLALRELFQVPAIDRTAPQAAAKELLPIPAFIDF
jgi:hypothetical protein